MNTAHLLLGLKKFVNFLKPSNQKALQIKY